MLRIGWDGRLISLRCDGGCRTAMEHAQMLDDLLFMSYLDSEAFFTSVDFKDANSTILGCVTPRPLPLPVPGGASPHKQRGSGQNEVVFDEDSAVLRMLAEHDRGEWMPEFDVPLRLEAIPRQAFRLRALAERIAIVMSLRLSMGDTTDVPISASFAARLIGLDPDRDKKVARQLLKALVDYRVIRHAGELPKHHKGNGTRTYQPYGFLLDDVGIENGPA